MTLLKMSVYGAVIIFVILLIRTFTLHKLPKKTFLILWAVALVRLLIPFEIASGLSLYSHLPKRLTSQENHITDAPNQEKTVIADEHNSTIFLSTDPADTEMELLPDVNKEILPTIHNTQSEQPDAPVTMRAQLPILWNLGTLFCAVFFLISYLRCRLEFSTSLPVTEDYTTEWLKQYPLKRTISLRQSDKISAPLTYGIFRPVILLPKNTDWNNRTRLNYVLYHEFTHIRRFDLAAKLIMIAAVCLHWFNPLVWTMYVFFNRDLELSCDDCVVKYFGETRTSYANTLIGMEEKKNYSAPLCNHFSKNAIEERITAIMKSKKTTLGRMFVAILIVAAVVVTLATGRKSKELTSDVTPTPPATLAPTATSVPTKEPPPPADILYHPEINYTSYAINDPAKYRHSGNTISQKDGYEFVIFTLVSADGKTILSDLTLDLEKHAGGTAWRCLATFYDQNTGNVYLEFVPAAEVKAASSGILHVTIPVSNPTAYTVHPAGVFEEQNFWFDLTCKIRNRIYFNHGSYSNPLWVYDLTTGKLSDLSCINQKMRELANELCAGFGWKHEPTIWHFVNYETENGTVTYQAQVCKEINTETLYTLYLHYEGENFLGYNITYHNPDPDAIYVDEQIPTSGSIPTTDGPDWYNAVSELMHGYTPENTKELPYDSIVSDDIISALKSQAASYLAQRGLGTAHHADYYAVCETGGYTVYAADISYSDNYYSPIYFTVYHAYEDDELVGTVFFRHQITFYDAENLSHVWANYITMDDVVRMAKEEFSKFCNTQNYTQPCEITSIHMTTFKTIEVKFLTPESDNSNVYIEGTVEFIYDFDAQAWSVHHFEEIPTAG